MLGRLSLCIGLVLGLILGGCEGSTPAPQGGPPAVATAVAEPAAVEEEEVVGEVVARYEGGALTAEELTVELQRLPRRSRQLMNGEGRARFVENHVLNELLFEEGKRRGLADDPEIARQIADMEKRLVVQKLVRELQDAPTPTDEEVADYYEKNRDRYSTTTIRARHILVRDEKTAKEIHDKLVADPKSFEALAKESSVDTASARKGGDLGFFGHGRMVPEFEEAAFVLKKPGDLSDVVKTQYGFHVIRLEERREGEQKPIDQVREQIRATLRHQTIQDRTQDYYEDLKKRANLQIDEVKLEEVAKNVPEPSPGVGVVPVHGGAGH